MSDMFSSGEASVVITGAIPFYFTKVFSPGAFAACPARLRSRSIALEYALSALISGLPKEIAIGKKRNPPCRRTTTAADGHVASSWLKSVGNAFVVQVGLLAHDVEC
ncbi:hypothetical protein CORC01_06472 [Colletotrichum orchidophilum]|uniref:Uncharacterized protein n=1 Tax=Colletotrichum orchidophilum TaxID=1209926 RepID=A0A1G4BAB6_9PEZI|nr:uncharacterized protein CORC01_06472 [Colletotrichum orchidophilum]OHE98275.1 hypothetical protein CORC01_06472 [Colletotrichum orchidophilum]